MPHQRARCHSSVWVVLVAAAALPACVLYDTEPVASQPDAAPRPIDAGGGPDAPSPPLPGDAGPALLTYDFAYVRLEDVYWLRLGNLRGASTWIPTALTSVKAIAVSPLGDTIAVAPVDHDRPIRLISFDGSARDIGIGRYAEQPAWSPDGSRLAYVAIVDHRVTVLVTLADGSASAIVVRGTFFDPSCVAPRWSPSGAELVFAADHTVQVHDIATGSTRTVATGVRDACKPDWSPDGRKIAFTHEADPSGGAWLDVVGSRGGPIRQLARLDVDRTAATPRWAPDGQSIVFVDQDAPPSSAALKVVDFTGAAPKLLADLHDPIGRGVGRPVWSPDGRSLLFVWFAPSGPELAVWEAATGEARGLGLAVDEEVPSWFSQPRVVP